MLLQPETLYLTIERKRKRNRERYDTINFKLPLNNFRVSVLFSITVICCTSFWSAPWKPVKFQTWPPNFSKASNMSVLNLVVHIRCCSPDKIPVQITPLICPVRSLFFISSLALRAANASKNIMLLPKRSFCTTLPKILCIWVDNLKEQYSNTLPAYLRFTVSVVVTSHCLLFIVYL